MATDLASPETLHERYARASTAAGRPRRRRRGPRWWWWAAAAALAAVAVVIADFPVHASAGYRRATLEGYLAQVDHDVAPCRAGLHDAVLAYVGSITGTPNVAPDVPGTFTSQGIAACGFTNSGVVDLGTTEAPRAITSAPIERIAPQVDAWAYLDAFTLLQDLRQVIDHPSSVSARRTFATELRALQSRRAAVERLAAAAERHVGAKVTPFPLTKVGSLLPGGRLPGAGGAR